MINYILSTYTHKLFVNEKRNNETYNKITSTTNTNKQTKWNLNIICTYKMYNVAKKNKNKKIYKDLYIKETNIKLKIKKQWIAKKIILRSKKCIYCKYF